MEMVIRSATASDAPAVADLLTELGYPAATSAATKHIDRFARDDASRLLVADAAQHGVVGLVATHLVPRLDDDGHTCRITDLVVGTTARRSGVGAALLSAAEDIARASGVRRLDLSSGDHRDAAHAFSRRHGFTSRARAYTKRLDG